MGIRQHNRLSARFVETAPDGFHADGGNLYLKVADGRRRRSWVCRFVRGGKVTSLGLGAAGESRVTLKEARAKRAEIAKLVEQGVNPLTERRKNQLANAQRKTFADAAAAYIEQRRRDWSTSSLNQWKHTVSRYCASITKLYVNEIVLDDVKRAVMPLVDKGHVASARQTQSRIQIVLNFAVEHGWRAEDRRSAWSPIAKRPKGERPHHPMLPWKEAPAFVAALRLSDGLSARVLEFLILTATRLSEAREARWSEMDLTTKTWTVGGSRTKTRQPTRVPLSNRALEIIGECKKHRVNELVFFGRHDRRPVSRMAVWAQCQRTSDGKASPHGFRATFRSWCADTGVEFEVAESALGHVAGGVVEAYQRSPLLERRRPVMADWAAFLSFDSESAEVVPLRRVAP
jgi:integrase